MLATRKSTYNDRYKLIIIGVVATCYLRESTKTWHNDNFWNTNRPVCVLLGLLDHRLAGRPVSRMNTRATYFIRNSDGYVIVKYGKGEIDRGEMNLFKVISFVLSARLAVWAFGSISARIYTIILIC